MPSFNQITLIGNATRDSESHKTLSGTPLATCTLAVNKKWKDQTGKREKTTFVDIKAWNGAATLLSNYLKKGHLVLIQGELDQDNWEKDGEKRSKLFVVVEKIQFLSPPKHSAHHSFDADEEKLF